MSITVDSRDFKRKLAIFEANVKSGVPKALMDVGFEIMRLSQREVPHDTGHLQNTGSVVASGNAAIVGYHTPYAARLHEHPEYRFQKGRKGKYLSDPIFNNFNKLNITFGQSFEAKISHG